MAKTTEELLQQAVQIRDEQANKKNTALRVGTLFSDIIQKQEETDQTHSADLNNINQSLKDHADKLTELGDGNIFVSTKNVNIEPQAKTLTCEELYVFRYNKAGKKSSYKLNNCRAQFKGNSKIYYEFLIYTEDSGLEFVYSSDEKIINNKADILGQLYYYPTQENTNAEKKYDIFFSGDYSINKIKNIVYNDIQGILNLEFFRKESLEFENGTISASGEESESAKRIRLKGYINVNPNKIYYFPRSDKFVVSYHEYADQALTLHQSASAWTTDKYYNPTYQYMRLVIAKTDSSDISVDDVSDLDISLIEIGYLASSTVLSESRSHCNYKEGDFPLAFGFGTFSQQGEVLIPYNKTRLVNANMINVAIGSEMQITIPSGYEYSFTSYDCNKIKVLDRGWNTEDKVICNQPYYNFVIRKPDNSVLTFDDIKKINEEFSVNGMYNDTTIVDNSTFPMFAYSTITKKHYPAELIFDIQKHQNHIGIQSLAVDRTHRLIYTLNDSEDLLLIDRDSKKIVSQQLKPSTGHSNDSCIVNNCIYVNGSTALEGDDKKKLLYKYDIESRTVEQLSVEGINDGSVGKRVIGGICQSDPENNSNILFIVTQDYEGTNINSPGAKITIYTYDTSTSQISEVFNLPWDGWFIQGATSSSGLLYIIGNPQPGSGSKSTYKGVFVYVVDLSSREIIDNIYIDGDFEPEGIDYIIENGTVSLLFGVAHYSGMAQVCKISL